MEVHGRKWIVTRKIQRWMAQASQPTLNLQMQAAAFIFILNLDRQDAAGITILLTTIAFIFTSLNSLVNLMNHSASDIQINNWFEMVSEFY